MIKGKTGEWRDVGSNWVFESNIDAENAHRIVQESVPSYFANRNTLDNERFICISEQQAIYRAYDTYIVVKISN